jgi:hypothetical protein
MSTNAEVISSDRLAVSTVQVVLAAALVAAVYVALCVYAVGASRSASAEIVSSGASTVSTLDVVGAASR